jgi:hypothetical protein
LPLPLPLPGAPSFFFLACACRIFESRARERWFFTSRSSGPMLIPQRRIAATLGAGDRRRVYGFPEKTPTFCSSFYSELCSWFGRGGLPTSFHPARSVLGRNAFQIV